MPTARCTGLEVSTPSLLVGYHIEKTAGSALMKFLHKQANAPPRQAICAAICVVSNPFARDPPTRIGLGGTSGRIAINKLFHSKAEILGPLSTQTEPCPR